MAGPRGKKKRARGDEVAYKVLFGFFVLDYRSAPPSASTRAVTRSVTRGLTKCANTPSPLKCPIPSIETTSNHSRTLTKAKRGVLKETTDDSLPENNDIASPKSISQLHRERPVSRYAIFSWNSGEGNNTVLPQPTDIGDMQSTMNNLDNIVSDADMSISADSTPHWAFPTIAKHTSDLDNLISRIIPQQSEVPRQVHYEPLKGDYIGPAKSTNNNSGRSQSNFTDFVKKLLNDAADDDAQEVESALNPALEDVNGHKVKREIAPLLKSIFDKYGDITNETVVKSPNVLSFFLESVCDVYTQLECMSFSDVSPRELNEMVVDVGYFESQKVNVGWLREKLEYIYQTKVNYPKYLSLKEKAAKNEICVRMMEKELDVYKGELLDLQKKVSEAEGELVAKKASIDADKELAQDIKNRLNTLKHSLVDGLI